MAGEGVHPSRGRHLFFTARIAISCCVGASKPSPSQFPSLSAGAVVFSRSWLLPLQRLARSKAAHRPRLVSIRRWGRIWRLNITSSEACIPQTMRWSPAAARPYPAGVEASPQGHHHPRTPPLPDAADRTPAARSPQRRPGPPASCATRCARRRRARPRPPASTRATPTPRRSMAPQLQALFYTEDGPILEMGFAPL